MWQQLKLLRSLPGWIFWPDLISYPKLDQDVCFGDEIKFICNKINVLRCSGSKLQVHKLNVWYGGSINPPAVTFWYKTYCTRWTQKGSKNASFQRLQITLQPLVNCSKSRSNSKCLWESYWKMPKILHFKSSCSSWPSSWTMFESIEIIA